MRWIHGTYIVAFLCITSALPVSADVEKLLHAHTTRDQLRRALGTTADRCFLVTGEQQLCQWSLSARDARWEMLAKALDTTDRVSVICELPVDLDFGKSSGLREKPGSADNDAEKEAERRPHSCTGYAERSNRAKY